MAEAYTELRAATALLAASSRTAERLRIARDLHDVLGRQLTALVLELEAATHASPTSDPPHVRRARDVARDLLGKMRIAVDELRGEPPALQEALADGRLGPMVQAVTVAVVRSARNASNPLSTGASRLVAAKSSNPTR